MKVTQTIDVDLEIDLSNYSDEEIEDEYVQRGLVKFASNEVAEQLYLAIAMGKPTDDLIREFIYQSTGKII